MPDKKPFHVSGLEPTKMKVLGVNIFPLIVKVTGLMSDETRKNQVTKKVAFNYLSSTFHPDARQATRSCTIPPERESESQREPTRASESQRETERDRERPRESQNETQRVLCILVGTMLNCVTFCCKMLNSAFLT